MIDSVSLYNYRNLGQLKTLISGANLIIAPNASGKSNFLEAIYLSALGRSFRPYDTLAEVIGDEDSFAKVEIATEKEEISTVITLTSNSLSKQHQIDGKRVTYKSLHKALPVVLFAPHSVSLVSEDPAMRRQDLDDFLKIWDLGYASIHKHYYKVLHNRNALLKQIREGNVDPFELRFWSAELAKTAIQLVGTRELFFEHAREHVSAKAQSIYKHTDVKFEIVYHHFHLEKGDYAKQIERQLFQNEQKEIAAGQTLYGPHKDDYDLLMNAKPLRYLGSRGEQRLGALIWKLAQADSLKAKTDQGATLLIDDLMSELDSTHRQKTAHYLLECGHQFIATAADEFDVPEELKSNSTQIRLV
ncbi:MAG: DNA replication and repair protein RecF [Candidatus Doudnabacteria bacterium]|nr:DNA replication and repair protein RecF [Candidatus Doudnabacteria bacterium]